MPEDMLSVSNESIAAANVPEKLTLTRSQSLATENTYASSFYSEEMASEIFRTLLVPSEPGGRITLSPGCHKEMETMRGLFVWNKPISAIEKQKSEVMQAGNLVEAVEKLSPISSSADDSNNSQLLEPHSTDIAVSNDISLEQKIFIANQGNKEMQIHLGDIFKYGLGGVEKDYNRAKDWYLKAAEQGHAGAQYNIGNLYENGHGVQQDYSLAMTWYKKAAEQGYAIAQNNIGNLYANGHGVQQDYLLAMTWYKKAAEQGNADGQYIVGYLYANGLGVQQDYSLAMTWYKKAAEQEYASAQYKVGNLYQHGQGVQKNMATAKIWYQKATGQGHEDARRRLKELDSISLSDGDKEHLLTL
ncbi:hypothetical protein FBU30_006173 [Linnemannia zychae]|nr:hypothetical protein FBU30_006173 [Linnemannia zychae]